MRLVIIMCKYISVLYVDINKFAIVVVHNGPEHESLPLILMSKKKP